MFSTYALQGIETKTKGVYTREELAPLAQTNVESLKEFDFFTFAKADGKKEKFLEPVDYFLEYKDAALTLHFTLPLKTPVKPKALALEVFDPALLHRLQVRRQGPDQAGRRARRLPDEIPAAAMTAPPLPRKTQRGEFRQRRQFQLRRDVRQQDHGAMPVTQQAGRVRARPDALRRGGGCCPGARRRHACPDGADAVRRAEVGRRRAAGRRHHRLDPGQAIGILPRDVRDHPRREVRRQRRSGRCSAISFAYGIFHAAGPGHGKAVISSYLVANEETARRGIVLSFASALMQSLVAVADRRDLRLAAQRHRQDHVQRRTSHRDRELRADRGVRRPAGLDQGRRFHARAADAATPVPAMRGRRRIIMATTMIMHITTIIITTMASSRPRASHHDHASRPRP